jgi:hypothetical protein
LKLEKSGMPSFNLIFVAIIGLTLSGLSLVVETTIHDKFLAHAQQTQIQTCQVTTHPPTPTELCPLYEQGHTAAGLDDIASSTSPPGEAGYGGNSSTNSMNYTHSFSSLNYGGYDIHGRFAQGYYSYFGIADNFTKNHDILGAKLGQYQTPTGAIYETEYLEFGNGTTKQIPYQNIG